MIPRIAPLSPTASFRVRFDRRDTNETVSEDGESGAGSGTGTPGRVKGAADTPGKQRVSWPSDDGGDASPAVATARPPPPPAWQLKTTEEEYIAKLEAKLDELAKSSNPDSGYASSPHATLSPSGHTGEDRDEFVPDVDMHDEDVEMPAAASGDGETEGLALLAASPTKSSSHDSLSPSPNPNHVRPSSPSSSPSRFPLNVIPPSPARGGTSATNADSNPEENAIDDSEREEEPLGTLPIPMKAPMSSASHLAASAPALTSSGGGNYPSSPGPSSQAATNRRISFSSSVRIAGGIRKTSRPPREPFPITLFTPATSNATAAAPSERTRLLATIAGATSSALPTASTSALNRAPSPNSSGIHARTSSGSSLYLPHHSGYSSAATSAVPSRSSSPCSSIYAPLQPPAPTCPSPLMARPPPKKSTRRLTFREFLRGRRDPEPEPERIYKNLIEAQYRKRQGGTAVPRTTSTRSSPSGVRRKNDPPEEKSVWEWIVELISSGAASAGSRGGLSYIAPTPGHQPRALSASPPSSSSTYSSSRARRKSFSSDDEGNGLVGKQGLPPRVRGRRPRRVSSTLSLSSVSDDADDEGDGPSPSPSTLSPTKRQPAATPKPVVRNSTTSPSSLSRSPSRSPSTSPSPSLPPSAVPKPKTETDVRFGMTPHRYANPDWWIWKGEVAARAISHGLDLCIGCCLGPFMGEEDVDEGEDADERRPLVQSLNGEEVIEQRHDGYQAI